MTDLRATTTSPARVKADALVVAVAPGPELLGAAALPKALRSALSPAALEALGATGGADQVLRIPSGGAVAAGVVVLTGTGPLGGSVPSPEQLRRAAGAAVRTLAGTASVALALPADDADSAVAVAEGALLDLHEVHRFAQVLHDGEPLGGRANAESDFAGLEQAAPQQPQNYAAPQQPQNYAAPQQGVNPLTGLPW